MGNGKETQLEDKKTFFYYNIGEKCTVFLVFRNVSASPTRVLRKRD